MIVMCSCGLVKVQASVRAIGIGDLGWAMAVDRDPSQPNAISHGYCPECAAKASRKLDEMERELGFDEITTEGGGA